ncbi:MAG: hypothetical protein AAFZ63_28565 [Bacteroidota bacterium]
MSNKICDFVKIFEGRRIIRESSIGPFSICRKSRLKEEKLEVNNPEFTLENNFSFDLLYLVNYPSKEKLKKSFIKESLLNDYYKNLFILSIVSLILEGRINFFCSYNSCEFMNGLTTDNYVVYSLSRGTFSERDTGLIEKGIYSSLYQESESEDNKIPLNDWVKTLLGKFLNRQKDYHHYCYITIGEALLRDTSKRFYWAQIEIDNPFQWKVLTRGDVYNVTIVEKMKMSMRRDLEKQHERIQQALKGHYLFRDFYQKLEKIIENEIRRRQEEEL